MTKRIKTISVLFVLSFLASCFLFASLSFGQEMPKPGEVIDKSNYKKYAHLFPPAEEGITRLFEDGWGLLKPITIKVSETKSWPFPKRFMELSEKNRGKYSLDKDGFIVGGFDHNGFPFPGITGGEKDANMKLMWNFFYKYMQDDSDFPLLRMWEKRKGEKETYTENHTGYLYFNNRLWADPKPLYKTPDNIQKAYLAQFISPPGMRNLMFLPYVYLDPRRADDTYLYIPNLRRVIRGEGGQRSTPIGGAIQSLDDYNGFDGKTQEFNYTLVKEQKVLGILNTTRGIERLRAKGPNKEYEFPVQEENWEVRDVWVIDIIPKDPRYPQSKKRIYLDKENLFIHYAITWDRAGKLWKVWAIDFGQYPLPDGTTWHMIGGMLGADLQFGIASQFGLDRTKWRHNTCGWKLTDFMPSAMLGRVM